MRQSLKCDFDLLKADVKESDICLENYIGGRLPLISHKRGKLPTTRVRKMSSLFMFLDLLQNQRERITILTVLVQLFM